MVRIALAKLMTTAGRRVSLCCRDRDAVPKRLSGLGDGRVAKGQKRSNREPKKPKGAGKPAGSAVPTPVRNLTKPGGFGRKAG